MDRSDFRLNWMLPAAPLGLPLRLRDAWELSDAKAKAADKPFRDFETLDFGVSTPAVAPAVAPSARPVGEPARAFKVGDWVRSVARPDLYPRMQIVSLNAYECRCSDSRKGMLFYLSGVELVEPAKREPLVETMVRQPELMVWLGDLMWESL